MCIKTNLLGQAGCRREDRQERQLGRVKNKNEIQEIE